METAELSRIYFEIAIYKKAKKVLLSQYILWILTFMTIRPSGLCHIIGRITIPGYVDPYNLFTMYNAIEYCNGRGNYYWWKHPYMDGEFTFDYKNRKKFLDWCISELEKKLK